MNLPTAFVQKLSIQHPDFADGIADALINSVPKISVRRNLIKNKNTDEFNNVAWCDHAHYLDQRPSFTMDPSFHGGAYYVQEASSMILFHILNSLPQQDNPFILDLCAAPGGKSTLCLDFLGGRGLLVANEVIKSRANILEENIIKWGYNNAVVTSNDPKDFERLAHFFDIIVIDAPCSGEGMFRKDTDAINEWSEDHVNHCSIRQQRIVNDVINSLKSNGYLIYSTCTFNHEENIHNVQGFIQKYELESIEIDMDPAWGIQKINYKNAVGYHFFPGQINGEGLFVAVLKQKDGMESSRYPKIKLPKLAPPHPTLKPLFEAWVDHNNCKLLMHDNGNIYAYNSSLHDNIELLLQTLSVKYSGTLIGNLQKKVFIPDHALAMSYCKNANLKKVELTKYEALKYLNRSLLQVESEDRGWLLVTYLNLPLGWLKNLGNRINNYYPLEWRIRKDISKE
jgi:16S rRNA C967 or C1407 C5-methylase (RsmB/RsmF family)/NOL1/NOP2/fmu family ribosome biogenesis protein